MTREGSRYRKDDCENLVLNSCMYCKPMERYQNRSTWPNVMIFLSLGDSTCSRIDNKLKTIGGLSCRKIEQDRVAVVNLGVNERSSSAINRIADSL